MLQSVYYDAAQTGLKPPSGLTELYIPLWVFSSGSATNGAVSVHPNFVIKGSAATGQTSTATQIRLHTLNANWSGSQKFALEASCYVQNGGTVTVALWDFTAGAIVAASQVSTGSSTATVIRSSAFALIPGRTYGVSFITNNTSYVPYINKAHLIALM